MPNLSRLMIAARALRNPCSLAFARARGKAVLVLPSRALSSNVRDSFMSGSNSVYVEQMYDAWTKDPSSVHASWAAYFTSLEKGVTSDQAFSALPSATTPPAIRPAPGVVSGEQSDSLGLSYLIRAYQVRGHEIANLDPLGLHSFRAEVPPELDYKFHGFTDQDLDRKLRLLGKSSGGNIGFLDTLSQAPEVTLRQVVERLQSTYSQQIGVEYMHIPSREKCNWIRAQVENPRWLSFTKAKKMHIFERLAFADTFEKFLGNKFNTTKRFGLDGGEAVIPGLKCMVDRGSELGIESFVVGMPHRGRLNVLANVLRKPMPQIFREFQGLHAHMETDDDDWSSSGDVKYHLGTSMDRTYPDGRRVHLSLVANPSHLEAVDPVVCGKTRAKQFYSGNREEDKKRHMSLLMHGDAAFAGQGVVYETMQLAKVADFATGGTIHVIVNNQVGFTTDPKSSRSTLYSSDLGKAFNIPIFHCNGDDPLSVCTAFEMAVEWRQQYGEDVIIDMICYRRYGHNELDQPMFTQPLLYGKIRSHPDTLTVYESKLVGDGTATKEECLAIREMVQQAFERDYQAAATWQTPADDWLSSKWSGFKSPRQRSRIRETGVEIEKLTKVGKKLCEVPPNFNLHPQLAKILQARKDTVEAGAGIDWGTAEALAFGTLLLEGNHVRLTGQDVERGTFSHRHAVVHDQKTGERFCSLNSLAPHSSPSAPRMETTAPEMQADLTVRNSILSEFAILGYELGYSLENPNALCIWEAQFGDFSNGAQIIIDQFLSAGEDKWLRQSGLVMLLPHGYDGQGAEHSSCRLERYLQMCDEDPDVVPNMHDEERMQIQHHNWQVVNCSTPANYYHVLRRQVHRDFRKPLIVASPKNLLRHKLATSTIQEMGPGTRFHRVFREKSTEINAAADKVRRLAFCSGKIYYELLQTRQDKGITDVALVRIEQIAPFPFDYVARECAHFPNAEVVWVQEEPKNMGAWFYVQPRIVTATKQLNNIEKKPRYIGRAPSASPATGMGSKVHNKEQMTIIEATMA